MRDPIGVVACITPWNFPVAIPTWKMFPALVAGLDVFTEWKVVYTDYSGRLQKAQIDQ